MNRFFFSSRFLVAATLATAALGAATVAEARPEVFVSIGLQGGPGWAQPTRGYIQPQRVYAQPRPIYVEPARVFVRPPVLVFPREVFERPRFGRYDARIEWERERSWRRAEWRRHNWRGEFRAGDREDGERHHDHRN